MVFTFKNFDWNIFKTTLNAISLFLLLLIFLVSLLQKFIISLGLKELFHFIGISNRGFLEVLLTNFKSSVYLIAIPGVSAPDIFLTAYYTQKGNSLKKVFTALLINRLSGMLIFLSISLFTLIFMLGRIRELHLVDFQILSNYLKPVFLVLIILISVILIFKTFLIKKWNDKKKDFKIVLDKWKRNKIIFYRFLTYKTIWYMISIFSRVLLGRMIGINIEITDLIATVIIVNFLIALPISISGLGIREISFITLLSIFGVEQDKAILLSILDFGILIFSVFTGLSIMLFDRVKEFSKFKLSH